jgi:hypothetical protein
MNFADIEKLKQEYPKDADILNSMWKDYQKSDALAELQNNPGIKELIKLYEQYVEAINGKLLADESMTEHERDILLSERRAYKLLKDAIQSAHNNKESSETLLEYAKQKRGN